MTDDAEVLYREAEPDDVKFVLSSWLLSFERSFLEKHQHVYPQGWKAEKLERLLQAWQATPESKLKVQPNTMPFRKLCSFYRVEHGYIATSILGRSRCVVACDEASPTNIYGWCCYETRLMPTVVHYIYVKQPMRNLDIGTTMLGIATGDLPFRYTHKTQATDKFLMASGYYHRAQFEPGLAFGELDRAHARDTEKQAKRPPS